MGMALSVATRCAEGVVADTEVEVDVMDQITVSTSVKDLSKITTCLT